MALEAYARQALNTDNERKCREIRIRAERKTGQLLREAARNGERVASGGGDKKSSRANRLDKLSDHGISKDQSSDWQKLATIPNKRFEQELKVENCAGWGRVFQQPPTYSPSFGASNSLVKEAKSTLLRMGGSSGESGFHPVIKRRWRDQEQEKQHYFSH